MAGSFMSGPGYELCPSQDPMLLTSHTVPTPFMMIYQPPPRVTHKALGKGCVQSHFPMRLRLVHLSTTNLTSGSQPQLTQVRSNHGDSSISGKDRLREALSQISPQNLLPLYPPPFTPPKSSRQCSHTHTGVSSLEWASLNGYYCQYPITIHKAPTM